MDFNFVTARLAVGGAVGDAISAQTLLGVGVTDIVDCQAEFDDHVLFDQPGISVLWIGVDDDGKPKSVDWFKKGIEFSLTALALPNRRLYVHCAAGVNRGPSMAYAVLRAWGFAGDYAFGLLRAARPCVNVAYRADADSAIAALGYV